jgi:hypothetical protein
LLSTLVIHPLLEGLESQDWEEDLGAVRMAYINQCVCKGSSGLIQHKRLDYILYTWVRCREDLFLTSMPEAGLKKRFFYEILEQASD